MRLPKLFFCVVPYPMKKILCVLQAARLIMLWAKSIAAQAGRNCIHVAAAEGNSEAIQMIHDIEGDLDLQAKTKVCQLAARLAAVCTRSSQSFTEWQHCSAPRSSIRPTALYRHPAQSWCNCRCGKQWWRNASHPRHPVGPHRLRHCLAQGWRSLHPQGRRTFTHMPHL